MLARFYSINVGGPQHYLHSFPTRRSSDLGDGVLVFEDEERQVGDARLQVVVGMAMNRPRMLRSEEHTSELQSHSDLVCRLLLEKKNTIQYEPIGVCVGIVPWNFPLVLGLW